jgi:superfamily II DNA or RNA helicase
MTIELKHPFKDKCPNIDGLLKRDDGTIINGIESLCSHIKKEAEKYSTIIEPEKYKGDALELFVEYLIKVDGADNRIGIYDYRLLTDDGDEDCGVDGHGRGDNQNPATVQVKFRRGDYVLKANEDHLSNFLTSSWSDYGVPIEDTKNMLIITTGLKVDEISREKMLKNKVRVLNRDALRSMCDNRDEFWIRFYESVNKSRVKTEMVKPYELREHQSEASEAVVNDNNSKGKVVLPTGCGKTIIEAEVIRKKIIECQAKNIVPVIKVNASRILLCFQLFEEIFKYLNSYGISAKYVNFNSGSADDRFYITELRKLNMIYREITSTTSAKAVKEEFDKSQKEGIPLIIVSTYHSSERFADSGIVPDITIHDEAHNLVSREFSKAAVLPSKADFYFTATEKVTDSCEDLGMNNEAIFDKMIYTKSAKEMIEKGEMVTPRIHIIKAKNGGKVDVEKTEADYSTLFNSITNAFFAHDKQIKEDSYDNSRIGAKILVVCRGQQDLIEMVKTQVFKDFRILYPDIHIFALSSEFGLLNDDQHFKAPVTNSKKFKFLKKLKELKDGDRCIVFHVDMIGEGVDIPGITGVMPFRNCELSKFVQNIGRAARLHRDDRRRFYAKEIKPIDVKKYIKPYSWIIIPTFLSNSDGFADRFRGIITKLRDEYGVTKENVMISNDNGLSEDEDIDVDNEIDKKKKHSKSGVDGFVNEFEEMTCLEKIIFDDRVEQRKNELLKQFEDIVKS